MKMKTLVADYRALVAEMEYWDGYCTTLYDGPDGAPSDSLMDRVLGRRLSIRVRAVWTIVRDQATMRWCNRFGHPARFVDVQHDGEWGRHVTTYCHLCHRGQDAGWF